MSGEAHVERHRGGKAGVTRRPGRPPRPPFLSASSARLPALFPLERLKRCDSISLLPLQRVHTSRRCRRRRLQRRNLLVLHRQRARCTLRHPTTFPQLLIPVPMGRPDRRHLEPVGPKIIPTPAIPAPARAPPLHLLPSHPDRRVTAHLRPSDRGLPAHERGEGALERVNPWLVRVGLAHCSREGRSDGVMDDVV